MILPWRRINRQKRPLRPPWRPFPCVFRKMILQSCLQKNCWQCTHQFTQIRHFRNVWLRRSRPKSIEPDRPNSCVRRAFDVRDPAISHMHGARSTHTQPIQRDVKKSCIRLVDPMIGRHHNIGKCIDQPKPLELANLLVSCVIRDVYPASRNAMTPATEPGTARSCRR